MKTKSIFKGIGIALAFFLFLSCNNIYPWIEGSGNIIKEQRDVSEFTGIDVGGAYYVHIKKGDYQSVEIETDDNIMPLVETEVSNGVLRISTKTATSNVKARNIYITMANLKQLDISGACKIESDDRFNEDLVDINLSGASNLNISFKANRIDMEMSGASNANISGHSNIFNIDASGASNGRFSNMEANTVSAECSGASSIWLNVIESIKGDASGGSNIYYKGNPNKANIETSGGASVERIK